MIEAAAGETPRAAARIPRYTLYVLLLLMVVNGVNVLDRNVLGLLFDPIKHEMRLTDTELGLISGLGFAVINTVLSLPISFYADRLNRRTIIGLGLMLYSAMTCLSGFAQNALQLTLARIGVGFGEGSGTSPTMALLADYFPREKRPLASAVFFAGSPLGTLLGFTIGGEVAQHYGWRAAFMITGLPGIVLAILILTTVAEPVRGAVERIGTDRRVAVLGETLRFLWRQPTYLLTTLGVISFGCSLHGMALWAPSLLRRTQHLSTAEVGLYIGLVSGTTGFVGAIAGGWLVQALSRRPGREWLKMGFCAGACLIAGPAILLAAFAPSLHVAIAGLFLSALCMASTMGNTAATLQDVARPRMRATAAAIYFATSTLFGAGIGPVVIGSLNEALSGRYGDNAIRYALIFPAACHLMTALLWALAARHVGADTARAISVEPSDHALVG